VVVSERARPERRQGKYRGVDYAMGGKNVFYFLHPSSRRAASRFFPVAYDVREGRSGSLTTDSHLRPFSDNAGALP